MWPIKFHCFPFINIQRAQHSFKPFGLSFSVPKKLSSSAYAVCRKHETKSQESVANPGQSLRWLGSRWYSRWRSWDVILCFLLFTWQTRPKPRGFRCYSHEFVRCREKTQSSGFQTKFKMAFAKDHANEWSFQRIRSNFGDFVREGKLFSKASFWLIIFPWNLARLISMDKRKFLSEPGSNRVLRLIYSLLKFRVCLHNIKVDNSTLKNYFYKGSAVNFSDLILKNCWNVVVSFKIKKIKWLI